MHVGLGMVHHTAGVKSKWRQAKYLNVLKSKMINVGWPRLADDGSLTRNVPIRKPTKNDHGKFELRWLEMVRKDISDIDQSIQIDNAMDRNRLRCWYLVEACSLYGTKKNILKIEYVPNYVKSSKLRLFM